MTKNKIIIHTIISLLIILNLLFSQSTNKLVWPAPPNDPKIEFINSFSNSADMKVKKSFLHKIWDRVIGYNQFDEMLVQPIGISGDKEGNIYVTDPGAKCVHIFNQKKKYYGQIRGKKDKSFKAPIGVAISESGSVYISDSEIGEIQVFNNSGDYQFTIKGSLVRPTGICINQNTIYVTDTELHKIFAFTLDGNYIFEFGGFGSNIEEFNRPIFITKRSLFYIADALNYRVQVLDDGFNNLFTIGYHGDVQGTFSRPKGIAVDSDENIYVADGLFDAIQIFNYTGELLLVFGNSGNKLDEFDMPAGIYIDTADQIYVVDTLNRRVQVFKYLK